MDPMDGARGQWSAITAAATQQVPVEVIDIDRGQLVHGEMTEVGLEVMLDDAARLAQSGRRPRGRRVRHPAVEQIGDGAGPQAGVAGLLDELGETRRRVTARAVHRRGRPPLAAPLRIDTEIDPQLPAFVASLS
jgi:hypothetical protein